jgi:hypothetical protein
LIFDDWLKYILLIAVSQWNILTAINPANITVIETPAIATVISEYISDVSQLQNLLFISPQSYVTNSNSISNISSLSRA